ncbi:MAG: hypothetical protein ABFD54_06470 [Armatimonadota bacterium]|nr:hypothetical protein [bacterium]
MGQLNYRKHEPLSLKNHPDFDEKRLQGVIEEDPSILGLGDLEVRDVERIQPKAGRLDLLLRDPETGKRYEVEIMLGATDESHIIRTIEYWDIERKRYPQYDHCAVIVAECVNSRFLNVIGLFNSAIPVIAIQLNALKLGDDIVLSFTKVIDEAALGLDDEDEGSGGKSVDRAYWETKGSKKSVAIVDECLEILREVDPQLGLNYNKNYIGLANRHGVNNFVVFRAKKNFIRTEARVPDQESWKIRLEEAGIVVLPGVTIRERLHFRLTSKDIKANREMLKELFQTAYAKDQE